MGLEGDSLMHSDSHEDAFRESFFSVNVLDVLRLTKAWLATGLKPCRRSDAKATVRSFFALISLFGGG